MSDIPDLGGEPREEDVPLQTRLHVLLEATGVGVWEYDHTTDRHIWSDAACAMLAYGADAMPSSLQAWLELIHPDDQSAVLAQLEMALGRESPLYQAEYRILKGDGDWLWIQDRGRVVLQDAQGRCVPPVP